MATQSTKHKEHSAHKDQKPHKPLTAPDNTLMDKLKWHVAALVMFFVVGFVFFKPMWIDGKELNQSDIVHYKGVSKELQDYRERTGKEALWTNSMFGGMPAFQVSTLYNGNLTRYVHSLFNFFLPHPSGLLLLSFVSMYILLLVMGCGSFLSIGGALVYGLCTYNLTLFEAGHNSKLAAMGYMPLVLAGMVLLFRRKHLWGFAVFALGLALEIRSNHLQITYYLALVLGIYFVVEAVTMLRRGHGVELAKTVGLMAGATLLAVLANASLLWSTSSYVGQTIRGKSELTSNTKSTGGLDKDYAFQWSYGKAETMTLLIPDIYGGSSNHELSTNSAVAKALEGRVEPEQLTRYLKQMPTYWGDKPFTSGPFYLGAIVCFLFVLGLLLVKDEMKWWLLGASALALLLAWGRNLDWFNDLMFRYAPGYNRFRTVEMSLIVLQLTFVIMAWRALQMIYWDQVERAAVERAVKIAGGITAGLCVLVAIMGSSFFDFHGVTDSQLPEVLRGPLVQDRKSIMTMDAWRSAGFIAVAAGLLWLWSRDKIRKTYALGVVMLLVLIDVIGVDKRYFDNDNFTDKNDYDAFFAPTPADEQILRDQSLDYRVLNAAGNTFNDSHTSYYHKSVGGYSAVKLRRYQELIDYQISKNNGDVLDMLNTKYIIAKGKGEEEQAQQNPSAIGNAWFVDSIRWVANADEEMNRIGPMYRIASVNGTRITVNGKPVTEAVIGNHDRVKIDTVSFDAAEDRMPLGTTDTLGIAAHADKQGKTESGVARKAQGANQNLFTLQYLYKFDPRRVAIVDEGHFKNQLQTFQPAPDPSHKIQLTSYEPNHLQYSTAATSDGFAVFSEIYYPDGWIVSIDGKTIPGSDVVRVNYVLRGMKIPAGKHTVDFSFHPKSFYTGEAVSMASSGLLLLLIIGLIARDFMERRKKQTLS